MSLDLQIRALLRTNEVKQISFTLRGITVSGHGFHELSKCFSDTTLYRRVRVTIRPELVGPHALASYDPHANKLRLRSGTVLNTAAGRAAVIHECTHAQLDLRGLDTSTRSEEGAAFVAEAWYLLACGLQPDVVYPGFPTEIASIAIELRQRAAHARGGSVALDADQINQARRVMAVSYGYGSGSYDSDGIRGYVYRGP